MLEISELFDQNFYLDRNPDVAAAVAAGQITAGDHFIQLGQFEGRDPSSFFQTNFYLQQHPDVAAAVRDGGITAIDHFIQFGQFEGRNPTAQFDTNLYLQQNPDVAAAVQAGEITAFEHFVRFGIQEGRLPAPESPETTLLENAEIFFDENFYLDRNPDVAAAVGSGQITAIDHFIQFGQFEGRNPTAQFDTNLYLQQNPDVAAAVQGGEITAFEHFVRFGNQEGRLPAPDFLGTTFDVVVTSAANNGNSAALRFDGLTGSFIGEFPDGGDLIDPRDIVLSTPMDPTDIVSVFPRPNTVLINGGNDDTLLFDAETGDFIETFIEFPDLNAGGAVFGPDGNYYAGARSLRTILRFDGETGSFIDQFIPDGVANFPRGFVFGSDGNLYLGNGADPATGSGGGTIVQFDGITGQVLNPNFVTDPQLSPLDVISGLDGNLYVSSEFPFGSADSAGTVRIYDITTGELLNVLDGGVDEEGRPRLSAPRGMGFGPDGNLYVSSTGTSSVLRFDGTTGEFMDVFIEFSQLNGQALNFVPSQDFLG